jgi:mono/diheme cytochrome c family protein
MPALTPLRFLSLTTALCAATLGASEKNPAGGNPMDLDPPPSVVVPPAPHLTVAESLASFEVEKGFTVSPLIAEPLIVDPVAMAIDEDGRLFVVEMRGYMIDTEGKGEDVPIGRISVHEEPDAQGIYQKHAVFLDNLLLPRAISFASKALVFADQNALYVVPRVGGKAVGPAQVIDPAYAGAGNVEHRSSGCMLALDNWYYSGACGYRYRQRNGRWERDITEAHGQWGISQDDYGRLMTNNNSLAMQGEILPPTDSLRNPGYKWRHKSSYFAPDNLVYPIRVNPGCNRAYIRSGGKDGGFHQEVGDDWKLRTYTAGCAPIIYRGGAFGSANDSIFVPEPAGNLVMRYTATHEDSGTTQVAHATPGHPFFASTDERFRPVYTYVGPSGELYVVDMHKGILQHKAYMTPYLKRQVHERHLEDEAPTGYGRIYKLVSSAAATPAPHPTMSTQSSTEVMAYLASPNSWWRETAQRVLIERGGATMVSPLAALAGTSENPLARVHALWTLEGLGAITVPVLESAAKSSTPRVVAEAIRLAETLAGTPQAEAAGLLLKTLVASAKAPEILTQAALSVGPLATGGSASAWLAVVDLASKHGNEPLIRDALLSGLGGGEADAISKLDGHADAPKELITELKASAKARQEMKPEQLSRAPKVMLLLNAAETAKQAKANTMPLGQSKFLEICAVCHSPDGKGLFGLGPPLAQSEWITGAKKTGVRIALLGLAGPVSVSGKIYKAPDIMPLMPGLSFNLKDEEIAAVLTYIRASFGNGADAVVPADVDAERKALGARGEPFTPEELSGATPAAK